MTELVSDGTSHIVVDAVADADLSIIAEACYDWPLLSGGSAVAMPLPALYRMAGLMNAEEGDAVAAAPEGGAIVLSGSCSAMTRQQVARFAQHHPSYRLDPVELARNGADASHSWLADQDPNATVLLFATAEPKDVAAAQAALGTGRAGEVVEQALSELALKARERGTRRFVVAGGETSGAVSKALEAKRLDIGSEIAPGVPWTFTQSGGHRIALALKSGNFGGPYFFSEALEKLG
ncbi:MAG: nucleotide-binding domain containing protein, partial [Pseudomonadota bacterium]